MALKTILSALGQNVNRRATTILFQLEMFDEIVRNYAVRSLTRLLLPGKRNKIADTYYTLRYN